MGGSPRDFYNQYLTIGAPQADDRRDQRTRHRAGLCIALACDLAAATSDAKMGMTFRAPRYPPGMGATWSSRG